jgi:glycosyltransferase involved in cell wall biosynthesis
MSISLCLMIKNEEHNLPGCLQSAGDLVDEIIVVDTGSTDRTKEVAAGFRAKVFDLGWVDDFAAGRNECIHHATGDWIFWMDADERVDEANREKLRALFQSVGSCKAPLPLARVWRNSTAALNLAPRFKVSELGKESHERL